MSTIDTNGKRKIANEIRELLNNWEKCVDSIGNEDAFSDRILDDLPELVTKLTDIK